MTDEEIAQLIYKEFTEKTLGATEQYLEIHQPVYVDGFPKIDRIDTEGRPDVITAYLPVKDEYFSFAVYIDADKQEIFNIGTESRNHVMLRVTSEILTWDKMQAFTKLQATRFWNNGDLRSNGKAKYKYSCIEFIPNPEPDKFEDKLTKLLNYIEQDKEGILLLGTHANTYIDITMDFHNGNQHLGGAFIDRDCIKRMNNLNLEIRFDFFAWGEPFK